MNRRLLFMVLAAIAASVVLLGAGASASNTPTLTAADIAQFLAMDAKVVTVLDQPNAATADPPPFHEVKPHEFDPGKTNLVQSAWSGATGCPTDAKLATPNADFSAWSGTYTSYTDPACTTGDPKDDENDGLLLVKTAQTITNFAAAVAELKGVKGISTLTELGYDIRKPGSGTSLGGFGSHCGFGAPRFDIITTVDSYFLGCTSPSATETPGDGWIRLRWSPVVAYNSAFVLGPVMGTVQRITIVFDEGQDGFGAPDESGLAVLDNIDVNGTLVGHGPDESEP